MKVRFKQTVHRLLLATVAVSAAGVTMNGMAQTAHRIQVAPESPENILAPADSYEEILKTFEREARAAYAIAKQSCQAISDATERKTCLAKARLQYDRDLRYARERAEMGH